MPKTIEVLLNRIVVNENGEIGGSTKSASLLSLSLAYPNVLTPERATVKALKLLDKTDINYETDRHPDTQQQYTFTDRIVWKEVIDGPTELTVSLATVHKTSKFEKFLSSMFGAVFGAAWKLAVGGITNVLLGAVVETVGGAHVKSFETEDEKSHSIGEARLAFDSNAIPASPWRLDLVASEDLTIERYELTEPGKPAKRVKRTILRKGDRNGFIELAVLVR